MLGFLRGTPSTDVSYNAKKSDLYEFDSTNLTRHKLSLQKLRLPERPGGSTVSALLKLTLKAKAAGRLAAPWLELRHKDGQPVRYYFGRGSRGIRYLDVSGLYDGCAAPIVDVQTKHLGIEQDVELLLFRNEPINGRVLILAPHPDDAEIAAFGLYGHTDSAVVTITAGDAGGPNYRRIYPDTQRAHHLKMQLRVWDSLAVPLLAGLEPERVANLGYLDEMLEAMHSSPSQVFTGRLTGLGVRDQRRSHGSWLLREGAVGTWESLILDVVHILHTFKPSIVVSPHPLLDAHPDHRYASMALFEAVRRAGLVSGRLFLYSNHPVYYAGWPFGPPGGPVSLPPWPKVEASLSGFYSYPLSFDDQVLKLFALEAMHDLRRAPPAITSGRWGALTALWDARDVYLGNKLGPYSYFRRAVRSRETFFVYPMALASRLQEQYLDAPKLW